jgi:hypothetical protein
MQKLIMIWLVGAAMFTLSPLHSASAVRPTDEDTVGAQAKIMQLQAILDDEDDEDLQGDEGDPDSQGDIEDDFEDQDDQEDPSDERGAPT